MPDAVRRLADLRRRAHRGRPARLAGVDRDRRRGDHDERGDRPASRRSTPCRRPCGADGAGAAVRAARRRGAGRGRRPRRCARSRPTLLGHRRRAARRPGGARSTTTRPQPGPSWVRGLMLDPRRRRPRDGAGSSRSGPARTPVHRRRAAARRGRHRTSTSRAARPSSGRGAAFTLGLVGGDPTRSRPSMPPAAERGRRRRARRGRRPSSTRTSPARARRVWSACDDRAAGAGAAAVRPGGRASR